MFRGRYVHLNDALESQTENNDRELEEPKKKIASVKIRQISLIAFKILKFFPLNIVLFFLFLSLWIFCVPFFDSIDSHSLSSFSGDLVVFANLKDISSIFPNWSSELIHFLKTIPVERSQIFVAMDESNSSDNTVELLRGFRRDLKSLGIESVLYTHEEYDKNVDEIQHPSFLGTSSPLFKEVLRSYPENGWTSNKTLESEFLRIPFIRRMKYFVEFRNRVLSIGYDWVLSRFGFSLPTGASPVQVLPNGMMRDSLSRIPQKKVTGIFLNDIYFKATDLANLLLTNNLNYHVACGLDFDDKYYDTLVGRDVKGRTMDYLTPFVSDSRGRWLMSHEFAVPVTACWNGAIVFDLKRAIEAGVTFRLGDVSAGECPHSECLLFPSDLSNVPSINGEIIKEFSVEKGQSHDTDSIIANLDPPRVYVNPKVLVAYNRNGYHFARRGRFWTDLVMRSTRWNKVSLPLYSYTDGDYDLAHEELEQRNIKGAQFDDAQYLMRDPPLKIDCPFHFMDKNRDIHSLVINPKLNGYNIRAYSRKNEKLPISNPTLWLQSLVDAFKEYRKCGGRNVHRLICEFF
eukprot:GDKJ01023948.1.p1 GENE.GDKJ01023948.1~~GDKJ01023948.1.p1  ORF type:complete len:572 (-),score=78.10 GDKJ01023948.1:15-1730(-)